MKGSKTYSVPTQKMGKPPDYSYLNKVFKSKIPVKK